MKSGINPLAKILPLVAYSWERFHKKHGGLHKYYKYFKKMSRLQELALEASLAIGSFF